jgi:hypothetical protein
MGRWKKKSPKKMSVRERQRLENINGGAATFGEIPSGRKFALTNAVQIYS